MNALAAILDARTMVIMAVVLYLALTVVMVYTYRYRKTYPGFGALTLSQVCWSAGVFLVFFHLLGDRFSLVVGNGLLFGQCIAWYHGIALYGGIGNVHKRNALNWGLAVIAEGLILYYVYADFDTCRRIVVFSFFCAMMHGRIALEPYCIKRWKTYSMQSVFSGLLLLVSVTYLIRGIKTLDAVDCLVGGPDVFTKWLLLGSMVIFPMLTFSLLSMTSSRVESELREAKDGLRHLADTDSLTGLSNRRHFLELFARAAAAAAAQGATIGFAMLDLDHFKDVNDTYGHLAGDRVLRAVGHCLKRTLPETCCLGRLGGEEFGIVLPQSVLPALRETLSRLHRAIMELHPDGLAVTASLGVVVDHPNVDALLAAADTQLYAAKRAGRNRIVCQDEDWGDSYS